MKRFKFDPSKKKLRKTLKEYEEIALRHIWDIGEEGQGSGSTWEYVNNKLAEVGKSISRASVIFFLDRMVEQGVLQYRETTGKGGRFRIYYPKLNEREYRKFMLKTIIDSRMMDFPEETKEVLEECRGNALREE